LCNEDGEEILGSAAVGSKEPVGCHKQQLVL